MQPPRRSRGAAPDEAPDRVQEDAIVDVEAILDSRVDPIVQARSRWVVWTWLTVAALVVALAALGAAVWVEVRAARAALLAAEDLMAVAAQALGEVEAGQAQEDLAAAQEELARARAALASFPVRVVSTVPVVQRNVAAIDALAASTADVAAAGASAAAALDELPGGTSALAPQGGRLPVDAIAAIAPTIRAARDALVEARADVNEVTATGVVNAVSDARVRLLERLDEAIASADVLSTITRTLPPFLGADEPRAYFVGSSNPTELRGSGGFIGAFTILRVDDGQMSFDPFRPIQDLRNLPASEVPTVDPSLNARYDAFGGGGSWLNINLTPDFPSAATAIEQLYAAVEGEELDGTILVDPFAFEALLAITGPVEIAPVGAVGADDVVQFVGYDAYAVLEDDELRKRVIGDVATATLERFLEGAGADDVVALGGAVVDLVARESILLHSRHDDEQAAFVELGAAGGIRENPGDLLSVVVNSASGSKIDWFATRTLQYDVELAEDGFAVGTLVAGFGNDAPSEGEPEYIIGPNTPLLTAGESLLWVSTYCAPGCTFLDVPDAGWDELPSEASVELGNPVVSTWLLIPPGQARELVWTFQVPGAWEERGSDRVYRLAYDHQPQIRATTVEVAVHVPPGFEPRDLPADARLDGDVVVWRTDTDRDATLEIRFAVAS